MLGTAEDEMSILRFLLVALIVIVLGAVAMGYLAGQRAVISAPQRAETSESKARAINVTTHGTTVTLSGVVESKAEHDRAMALARETDGVTQVIDDLHTSR